MTRALTSRLLAVLLVFGGLVVQAPVAHAADADAFTIAPTTLTFPATAVGETSAGIAVTVTNAWGISQTLTTVAGGVPFDAANFSTVQNCAGVTLAPGASCAFTYTFTPTTTGPLTTTTNFSINGQPSGTITLNGTGTPAFTIAPTTITFPTTVVADTSAGIDVTITNASGVSQTLAAVAGGAPIDTVNFGGFQNCVGVTLAPGASCAFTYTFHPTTTGPLTTTTSFSINGQASGTITLNGTGTPAFTIAPTTVNFPATAVGDTSAGMDVTITNATSSSRTLTAVAGGAPFDSANFGGFQNCVGVTLAPSASCAFTYTFHPTTTGPLTTTTSFSINGQASGTITLNGIGTPIFGIAPTTITFPDTAVGDTSAGIDVTVTNLASTPQTLTSGAGGAPFDGVNFGGVQNCVGVTLAPGASCAFTYSFHPTTLGPLTTTTNFTINGQAFGTVSLSGTGIPIFGIAPTTITFPTTAVGDTSAGIDVTVTNLASTPQTLTSVAGGAPFDGVNFGGVQNCAGVTLAPGASCAFTYSFHPTTDGPLTTTTNFTINGQASGTITLNGNGTTAPILGIAPSTVTFSDTEVGSTSTGIDVTITNVSADSQTLTSVAGGAPLDGVNFGGVQNCVGVTLAPGASCAFTYSFHPTTVGLHSTTTTISITTEAAAAAARAGRSVGVRALAVPAATVESGIITLSGTGIETTTTATATTTTTALPATGANLTFPLGLALIMMLLGSAFVAVVRRSGR